MSAIKISAVRINEKNRIVQIKTNQGANHILKGNWYDRFIKHVNNYTGDMSMRNVKIAERILFMKIMAEKEVGAPICCGQKMSMVSRDGDLLAPEATWWLCDECGKQTNPE